MEPCIGDPISDWHTVDILASKNGNEKTEWIGLMNTVCGIDC